MRRTTLIVFALAVLPLLSCHKGEKDRLVTGALPGTNGATGYGIVSIGKGGSQFASPSSSQKIYASPNSEIQRGKFTVESIEFSLDETNWTTLTNTPFEAEVEATLGTQFNRFSVGPFSIPAGEYRGLRIKLAPGFTVLETLSGNPYGSLNDFPRIFINRKEVGITSEIVYTVSNGRLSPFAIHPGKESFVILGVYIIDPHLAEWRLEIDTMVSDTP